MPIQTGRSERRRSIPEKLRNRLAKFIQRYLLWRVPMWPRKPGRDPMPLPPWVRSLFALDPHNAETVLLEVELAYYGAPNVPEEETEQWRWLRVVAYRVARELALRESPHLAALQPPPSEENDRQTWELAVPCSAPSPEELASTRELLAHSLRVWGDSEKDLELLASTVDGPEAEATPNEGTRRRRNIFYRRSRVRDVLESLGVEWPKRAA